MKTGSASDEAAPVLGGEGSGRLEEGSAVGAPVAGARPELREKGSWGRFLKRMSTLRVVVLRDAFA